MSPKSSEPKNPLRVAAYHVADVIDDLTSGNGTMAAVSESLLKFADAILVEARGSTHAVLPPAVFRPLRSTVCPCMLAGPCSDRCTCADPLQSGGCRCCATYGDAGQRQQAAEHIFEQLRAGHAATHPNELSGEDKDLAGLQAAADAQREKDQQALSAELVYLVRQSAPLSWAAYGNTTAAHAWEARATDLIRKMIIT